jgi:hypothetical protein
MTWEDVYRRKGFVEIEAQKAKTARRRLVPMGPPSSVFSKDRKQFEFHESAQLRGSRRLSARCLQPPAIESIEGNSELPDPTIFEDGVIVRGRGFW